MNHTVTLPNRTDLKPLRECDKTRVSQSGGVQLNPQRTVLGSEREVMNTTIGTCSICGGPVQVPEAWGSVLTPTPACLQCGAVAAKDYGPVIPMTPGTRTASTTTAWLTEAMERLAKNKPDHST